MSRTVVKPFEENFYNLSMTYRLNSDIFYGYGRVVDLKTDAVVAPKLEVTWRQPPEDFKGRTAVKS
jgi:alpha-1,3-fucosyltransferase